MLNFSIDEGKSYDFQLKSDIFFSCLNIIRFIRYAFKIHYNSLGEWRIGSLWFHTIRGMVWHLLALLSLGHRKYEIFREQQLIISS